MDNSVPVYISKEDFTMIKKINTWLDKPFTWRSYLVACFECGAISLLFSFIYYVAIGWIKPFDWFKKKFKKTETEKK